MLTTIHMKENDPPDKHIGGHTGVIFSTNMSQATVVVSLTSLLSGFSFFSRLVET